MGAKTPKAKKQEPFQTQVIDNSAQLTQQYQESLAKIQQQSNDTLAQVNSSNQNSLAAIQSQIDRSNQDRNEYQGKLQEYLAQMTQVQQQNQAALAERDAKVQAQTKLQNDEIEGNNAMNGLMAATTIAKRQFSVGTQRQRGFIG